ncbi:hypothetical protein KC842_00210 [Candidatus Nomurabacteria bacterium]|nr:hypothetical protein [Candidatus Nomurabacteria bacterium]USN94752.1 MAG: hypothetical protein H6791_03290 [Candidatus Nomurabacteria bacterium]
MKKTLVPIVSVVAIVLSFSYIFSTDKFIGGIEPGNIMALVRTADPCKTGQNDDYLHPERFLRANGSVRCKNGVVIFDHHITPKFIKTIIPYVYEQTGVRIDLNDIDFYITLPETGEQVVYQDIFNWTENGQRAIFNTNELLWKQWRPYLEGDRTHDFGVSMIHRPTGTDVSIVFGNHDTMTLYFVGLQ